MNRIFLILFFLIPEGQSACLPDLQVLNPLDSRMNKRDLKNLESTVSKFEAELTKHLPLDSLLIVNLEMLNPAINAEIRTKDRDVIISVWGGMLSHPLMSEMTLLLLLCHEIGHVLGGPPLKSRGGWSSTEGQADFYSTSVCLRSFNVDEVEFIDAALNLTRIYAQVTHESEPALDRCDPTVATRINYGYPLIQCRLDTLLSGWKQGPRPGCWYLD